MLAGEQFLEAAGAAAAACAAAMDPRAVAGLLWAFGTLVRGEPSPVSAAAAAEGGPATEAAAAARHAGHAARGDPPDRAAGTRIHCRGTFRLADDRGPLG